MAKRLFDDERTLFQRRVNELSGTGTSVESIDSIIKYQIGCRGDDNSKRLVSLYDVLGIDDFFNVLDVCEGQVMYFPTMSSINDAVQSAMAFYYKVTSEKNENVDDYVVDDASNPSKVESGVAKIVESLKKNRSDDPKMVELADLMAKHAKEAKQKKEKSTD